ncbi:MAG: hypothetical protein NC548_10990 [Lachnospiraceae bacterium]|nr:hypothetical protein [Lachnospiraceae bacterium]
MKNYKKMRSKQSFIPTLLGVFMTILLFVPTGITTMEIVKQVTGQVDEANAGLFVSEDTNDDAQFSFDDTEFDWDELESGTGEYSTDNPVTFGDTYDDGTTWQPESVEDAYDYDTGSDASFDSSFVDGEVPTSDTDVNYSYTNDLKSVYDQRWDNLLTLTKRDYSIITVSDLASCADFEDRWSTFDDTAYDAGFMIDETSWSMVKDLIGETCQGDVACFGMILYEENGNMWVAYGVYGDSDTEFENSVHVGYRSSDQASLSFTKTVSDAIDTESLSVVQTATPEMLNAKISTKTLFNRFDDKMSMNTAVRVTDLERFYDAYDSWLDTVDDVDCIGFMVCDNASTNVREFSAFAYLEGVEVSSTTYETELII